MDNTKEILTLAVEIGDAMLRCGAEIYRVEDSVIRILEALGLDDFDAYVLSNGIFASANESREDACSVVRYVPLSATHLGKLAALNQLTRDICNHKCSVAEASERLKQCKKFRFMRMRYSYWHVESVVQRLPSCLEGICRKHCMHFCRADRAAGIVCVPEA